MILESAQRKSETPSSKFDMQVRTFQKEYTGTISARDIEALKHQIKQETKRRVFGEDLDDFQKLSAKIFKNRLTRL